MTTTRGVRAPRPAAPDRTQRPAAAACATPPRNGPWARRGFTLDPGFVHTVQASFGEVVTSGASSAKPIDDWTSGRTHGIRFDFAPFVVAIHHVPSKMLPSRGRRPSDRLRRRGRDR